MTDPNSLCHRLFNDYRRMLKTRTSNKAFHPMGEQQILDAGKAVFAIIRTSPDESTRVLCLHNLSAQPQSVELRVDSAQTWVEICSKAVYETENSMLKLTLSPYQVLWLQ